MTGGNLERDGAPKRNSTTDNCEDKSKIIHLKVDFGHFGMMDDPSNNPKASVFHL